MIDEQRLQQEAMQARAAADGGSAGLAIEECEVGADVVECGTQFAQRQARVFGMFRMFRIFRMFGMFGMML